MHQISEMKKETVFLALVATGLFVGACKGREREAGDKEQEARIARRMFTADSLYSAATFRKAVRSTTFVPNDSIHDFGLIGGTRKVSHQFVFTNMGVEPVVIDTVKSHCGCTTSSYTREPVLPDKTGTVTVTYDPTDHYGGFRKTVTLVLNGGEEYQEVRVEGQIKDRY